MFKSIYIFKVVSCGYFILLTLLLGHWWFMLLIYYCNKYRLMRLYFWVRVDLYKSHEQFRVWKLGKVWLYIKVYRKRSRSQALNLSHSGEVHICTAAFQLHTAPNLSFLPFSTFGNLQVLGQLLFVVMILLKGSFEFPMTFSKSITMKALYDAWQYSTLLFGEFV